MPKRLMLLLLGIVSLLLIGCGGGTVNKSIKTPSDIKESYTLPKGMKLVNVTDRSYNYLGVLTRPMRPNEKAETYTWYYLDGGHFVTIKEEK